MRPLIDMDTVQIEITNACQFRCSNCTRLVGHHKKTYFMPLDDVKHAIDTMIDYPKMTGIMGGEPILHPDFVEICEYLHSKIPPERTGLWTCFPEGFEHYREVIVKTFGNIFLNDQSREDILHAPVLVASEELPLPIWVRDYLIDHCWVQNSWSASINPHGGFFCEIAGALSMLLDTDTNSGWKIEPGWWQRTPKDFVSQINKYCKSCGAAMPLKKRESVSMIDDISPGMYKRISNSSPKIRKGLYEIHNLSTMDDKRQMASYKDEHYRANIAKRYGMFLSINERGFQTPYLYRNFNNNTERNIREEVSINAY